MTCFELEYSMDCSVNCICNKCNTELDIQSVDASFSGDITVRVSRARDAMVSKSTHRVNFLRICLNMPKRNSVAKLRSALNCSD